MVYLKKEVYVNVQKITYIEAEESKKKNIYFDTHLHILVELNVKEVLSLIQEQ